MFFSEKSEIFSTVELNERYYFFSCYKCHNIPSILLKNNNSLIIECNNCGIKQVEKIRNISNYSTEWISNEVYKSCVLNHEEKRTPLFFCKICNLNLCEECSKLHNKNHELENLKDFNISFCSYHNIKMIYFCQDCDTEFCDKCINSHKNHNYIKLDRTNKDKINGSLINLNMFENFLINTKEVQRIKLNFVNETLINLKNYKGKEENKQFLFDSESKILKIFYEDFETQLNLIFLSKILFATYRLSIKLENNIDNIRNYKTIMSIINNSFKNEEIVKFKSSIKSIQNEFETISDNITNEEKNDIEKNIKNIFETYDDYNVPDKDSKKNFIEKSIKYMSNLKKYITIQKEKNPNNYIDINKTLYENEKIYGKGKSLNDESYLLSIFGKFLENNDIEVNISKKKDNIFKDIELASIQTLFSLGNQIKYELHFDFGEDTNRKILNNPEAKEKFLKDWKIKIAQKLNINDDDLILTNVHRGSVAVHLVIINSTPTQEKKAIICLKEYNEIKKINEKPMIDILQISPDILDKRGNRYKGWGINEKRGGEKYIPPLKDWYGIGLNVRNKYDNGNNDWLDYRNKPGEYAIAYIGISNKNNDKTQIIEDVNEFSNYMDVLKNKLYINENNIRKKSSDYIYGRIGMALSLPFYYFSSYAKNTYKGYQEYYSQDINCGDGVCVFQNPEYAENSAGFIDLEEGYRIKIMLMCRVNPNKIRQPKNYPECWILNPNEIRPYRILMKVIPTSSLTDNNCITLTVSPINYIIEAIKTKDLSIYEIAKRKKFESISTLNGQSIKEDTFVIRLYTSIYFKFINEYLRTKKVLKQYNNFKGFSEKQLKSWIFCLHLALSRNKNVKENTVVYRGIKCKFSKEIGIGSKFYFKEFLSTSTKKEFCEDWIVDKKTGKRIGTIMTITIKNNGINGCPNYCYNLEDITYTKNQYEVLISSHCYFTVTKIIRNTDVDYVDLICEGFLIK